jgi:hypothetical protein
MIPGVRAKSSGGFIYFKFVEPTRFFRVEARHNMSDKYVMEFFYFK